MKSRNLIAAGLSPAAVPARTDARSLPLAALGPDSSELVAKRAAANREDLPGVPALARELHGAPRDASWADVDELVERAPLRVPATSPAVVTMELRAACSIVEADESTNTQRHAECMSVRMPADIERGLMRRMRVRLCRNGFGPQASAKVIAYLALCLDDIGPDLDESAIAQIEREAESRDEDRRTREG